MRKMSFHLFLLGLLVMTGCSSNGTKQNVNAESQQIEANVTESEAKKNSTDVVEKQAFLADFYKKNIAEEGGNIMMIEPKAISEYLTEQAKKTLLNAYDMECPTNDCLAVWLFYGEGVDDVVKSISIVPADKKGYFNVELSYNGGNSHKVSIEIIRQDGKLKINDICQL